MSILFHLKKFIDPKNAEEKREQENSSRMDDLLGAAEGPGIPEVEVPDAAQPTYVCQHCGFTSEKKNYCGECLTFMEVARD